MIANTPYLLLLSIAPTLVNGISYVAVRHIHSKQDQELIRHLPLRYRSHQQQCCYFAKTKAFWTQLKMLFSPYDIPIEPIDPIVVPGVILCLCFIV
ncbi:MAG TPA: hypothetical protein PKD30_12450 [Saprospiraceae bacterium]|nr:hypothetical protein [Saprospiraceae bacterium]HMX89315.1 hypothetical protein [Saprospiraceae bacterium]HMZ41189.1 hypothetical protein [Saprospiraceae bacterium]HNA64068.1 hypothetical protein [Saprospiraceae bacterium]HNB30725.1 hypothetical protein [Saprospiraceae bacterium]